jgi:hypothetical protein
MAAFVDEISAFVDENGCRVRRIRLNPQGRCAVGTWDPGARVGQYATVFGAEWNESKFSSGGAGGAYEGSTGRRRKPHSSAGSDGVQLADGVQLGPTAFSWIRQRSAG